MARGNDPGKDFDDQWHASKRRGQYKASRGEGAWAQDKYLKRNNERLGSGPAHHGKSESCGKATVFLLSLLGGLGWFAAEAVNRIT
jgi:hypothetical protein